MGYTLYEREGKRGKSFRVLLRHHSRFFKIRESRTFPTKREAIAWAEEFEHTLKTQGQPPTPTKLTVLTFQDALLRYQQERTLFKARGTQLLERPQHNYWNEKLGHLPLKQITGQVVNRYITELMTQLKTSTVKRYFCTINHMFNTFVEWDLLPSNPLAKVKRVKIRDKRIRFLDAHERQILLHAAKEDRNPCIYPYIVLCLDVGLRREECRSLRWCDIHYGEQTITIWK